jgi:hypothetical protein
MGKNEKTGSKTGSTASKLLKTGKGTPTEIRRVAAAALTQRPDKPKRK